MSPLHHQIGSNTHNNSVEDTQQEASPAASLPRQQQQSVSQQEASPASSLTQQQQPQSTAFFIAHMRARQHNDDDDDINNKNEASTRSPARLDAMAPRTPSPRKLIKHTTPSPRPCPFQLATSHDHQSQTTSTTALGKNQKQPTRTTTRIRTVYLIRHGESVGQTVSREARERNANLLDCGLTETGRQQARSIHACLLDNAKIRLVLSSPLTRALETAILAFANNDIPIVVHYELRELGRIIPENTPRAMAVVLKDLFPPPRDAAAAAAVESGTTATRTIIDTETFRPDQWPRDHDTPPKVVRRDRIRQVFQWLASSPTSVKLEQRQQQQDCSDVDNDTGGRNENDDDDDDDHDDFAVAVVCHYHVIRAALSNPHSCRKMDICPENAKPIKCRLHADGRLTVVAQDSSNQVRPPRSNDKNKNDNNSGVDHSNGSSSRDQKNLDQDFLKQPDA
jgi:Histidine phosphatase superfamily (branch 1)